MYQGNNINVQYLFRKDTNMKHRLWGLALCIFLLPFVSATPIPPSSNTRLEVSACTGLKAGLFAPRSPYLFSTLSGLDKRLNADSQECFSYNRYDEINANLTSVLLAANLPALAASRYDIKTGYSQAQVGVHKIGSNYPVQPTDLWHIGSNTKAMAATAVGLLVQDGLVRWDTPVSEVFANYSDITLSEENGNITIEQLTSHTSGLNNTEVFTIAFAPPDNGLWYYNLSAMKGRAHLTSIALNLPRTHGAGIFDYSNIGYVVLGAVIDAIAGHSAEEVIQSRLWGPLNMTTPGWGPLPEPNSTTTFYPYPHVANGTNGLDGLPIPVPMTVPLEQRDYAPALHTAGMAHMTLRDYQKWLRIHVDKITQQQLDISTETLAYLHTAYPPESQEVAEQGCRYTYGGWFRCNETEDGNVYGLTHTGSNVLNYFEASIDLQGGVSVAAATNVGSLAPGMGAVWVDGVAVVVCNLLVGEWRI